MEQSNTIEKNDLESQTGKQLAEIQRMAGNVQERLAEARSVKAVCDRSLSPFQYEQYVDCIMEAAERSERLTEQLRRLVLGGAFGIRRQREYRKKMAQVFEVAIEFVDSMLVVEFPFLLPHRKNKYTDYIYKPLYLALGDWCLKRREEQAEIPLFERAVAGFVHSYDGALPRTRIRDHDNIEEKQAVDAMGMFFLVSDGGLYLDTYHTSILGERDRTFLFLMEPERFSRWIGRKEYLDFVSR